MVNPVEILSSDLGIRPGDASSAFANALSSIHEKCIIVLESGVYEISENLEIPAHISIKSKHPHEAVLRGMSDTHPIKISFAASHSTNTSEHIHVSDIAFDNTVLSVTGGAAIAQIEGNVFYNTKPSDTAVDQLLIAHGEYTVSGNTFISNIKPQVSEIGLRAIGTYKTKNSEIFNNTIGSSGFDGEKSIYLPEFNSTVGLNEYSNDGANNYFLTGIGGRDDSGLRVFLNSISGDLSSDYSRDHAIYFHHFDDLEISQNYFSGWPRDSTGGVKIRNGENLIFRDNILDDISLLLFSYKSSEVGLRNVFVFNNQISAANSGIIYWEDGANLDAGNFFIYNNILDVNNEGYGIEFVPYSTSGGINPPQFLIAVFNNIDIEGNESSARVRSGFEFVDLRDIDFHELSNGFIMENKIDLGWIVAGDETSSLTGTLHGDVLLSSDNHSKINAGSGNDVIMGGNGDDNIFGEDGDDLIDGNRGNDTIYAGYGSDTIISESGIDFLYAGAGSDVMWISGSTLYNSGTFAVNISSDTQVGTNSSLDISGFMRIEAVVHGGDGVDIIGLSDEGDAFFLEDSTLNLFQTDYPNDPSNDEAYGPLFSEIEVILAMSGDDIIDLTSADYILTGYSIRVEGGDGNDVIWGSEANETISGGNGLDTIFGGSGTDILIGGEGADVFEFTRTSSDVTLADFDPETGDIIRFYNTGFADFDPDSLYTNGNMIYVTYTDIISNDDYTLSIELASDTVDLDIPLSVLMDAVDFF